MPTDPCLDGTAVRPLDMTALELGEGARWWASGPVQVDLLAGRLLAVGPDGVEELVALDVPLGAAAPRAGGGLALVAGTGVRLLDERHDEEAVHDTGLDPRRIRVNDACTDAAGCLWFTVMAYDGSAGAGSLWRLDAERGLARVLDGVTIPNGPVIDADRGVLYLADSSEGVILRAPFDPGGGVGRLEPFAEVAGASPDGMALDTDGGLWSALHGGSRLHRYDAGGRLDAVVPLPASQPTSIALDPAGGPALVTTARQGLDDPDDADGRSLRVDLGRSGTVMQPFAG